ncbi:hypothetical protein BZA05DRAFT_395592 [Tricharina praecox]|uniref:uncharacterized protein n=1 Tax=Tricharina praecox TaxID=43433 RepID=UPI00221FE0ED|nr:uncharacterized protein BZA05DRAFT_395592 [Tricharina praecox]KAI5853308.1 hypothetical protein BZA05DRAFT_395592 [Tricharina praecox]
MALKDAVAFRPTPVTILSVLAYFAILSALLWTHFVPPPVASHGELDSWGIDFAQAWQDLRVLTKEFRPYNSARNDEVRKYLLNRVEDIVKRNVEAGYDGVAEIVDDNESNVLFAAEAASGLSVYFEGTNIIVHVHGSDASLSPVLVNAHYDSVSTGYGATDDGMAVVSVLQVIQAFTHPSRKGDKRIKRGLIALLNNGEEDFLNGAAAWSIHPMANLSHSFLNLEGAGAGGRATLFRSTDAEVTRWYKQSKRPFGTVVSGDGFKQGLVKSQTDYKIFTEQLGMRGLDVAFWEPRSRYHTQDDDVKHSSKESLWHMLGTSLQTLEAATSDTTRQFDRDSGPPAGIGHTGVWFDLFGRTFAVLRIHTLFALTITLIVVPFVIMAITTYFLYTNNKLYYLSNTPLVPQPSRSSNAPRTTRGWRGLLRFPVAFVIATGATIGLAFLVNKVNPMIAYSSQYSVWAMFLALWWSLAWFVLRGADADTVRPTALGRGYAFIEQWLLWWVIMIAVAVSIDRKDIASGYWMLISYAGVFLCAWISLLELFGLPSKPTTLPLDLIPDNTVNVDDSEDEEIAATERTPLNARGLGRPPSFGGYGRGNYNGNTEREEEEEEEEEDPVPSEGVFGREQAWSKDMPTWVWIPQFFLSVPLPLIFTGSVALVLSTAANQTGADGSSTLTFYLLVSALSVMILLPGSPFYHRISYHVTLCVFLAFLATLIYNLTAFPFSTDSRLKVYFQQSIDLTTGNTSAYLVGHPDFVPRIVKDYIPSAHTANISVHPDPLRVGLTRVEWSPALTPAPVPGVTDPSGWLILHATRLTTTRSRFVVTPANSRACKLIFVNPVTSIRIFGKHTKVMGKPVHPNGAREIRLWTRSWDESWDVEVEGEGEMKGRVVCLWSDANDKTLVPALWEVERFLPAWAVVSKLADGLVEGWKEFTV